MRTGLLTASLFPLAACMVTPSGQPGTGEPIQTCRNEALAQFTGQPATQDLGARMLAASRTRVIRWVAHGMMVTMDYRADRITVFLDASNRVERASCG